MAHLGILPWQFLQPLVTLTRVSCRGLRTYHPPTNPIGIASVLHRPSPSREIGTAVRRPLHSLRNYVPSQSHSSHTGNRIPPNRTVYAFNTHDSIIFVRVFARRITGKINCRNRQGSSKNRILCLPLFRFRMALVPTRPDQEPPNGGAPLLDQVRIQEPRPSRTSPQIVINDRVPKQYVNRNLVY